MLVKIKKDLAETKNELKEKTLSEVKMKTDLEIFTQKAEEDKMEISKLTSEVRNLQQQVR